MIALANRIWRNRIWNMLPASCLSEDLFWGQTNDHTSRLTTPHYYVGSKPRTPKEALEAGVGGGVPYREGEAQVTKKAILEASPQLSAGGS